jgi:nicotinamidase-related amidase
MADARRKAHRTANRSRRLMGATTRNGGVTNLRPLSENSPAGFLRARFTDPKSVLNADQQSDTFTCRRSSYEFQPHSGRHRYIIKAIQDVFPEQKPINRSSINAWQDARLVEAVRKSGRRKLVIAGLWTEVCVAMPALQAQGENYDVYAVTDASGGVSVEAHAMGVQRMVQAGIKPITWLAVLCEWQRDWARQETIGELARILTEHGGGSGVAFSWEAQLLAAGTKTA